MLSLLHIPHNDLPLCKRVLLTSRLVSPPIRLRARDELDDRDRLPLPHDEAVYLV